MSLRISGKNLDIGETLRSHIDARVGDAIAKYFDGGFTGHVVVSREGSGFRAECVIHLDTGIVLQSEGSAQDAHQSFEMSADRIEKRLRRYKGRLKDHHTHGRRGEPAAAVSYVLAAPDDDTEAPAGDTPTIVAEETTVLETMTVSGAVMAMDLADLPVVVFRHAGHGGINVVYRRADGHIGWIDPSLQAAKAPPGR
ncbi:MAG: ribosome-associated translation inhibitor RaiA [Bauldia sp.]